MPYSLIVTLIVTLIMTIMVRLIVRLMVSLIVTLMVTLIVTIIVRLIMSHSDLVVGVARGEKAEQCAVQQQVRKAVLRTGTIDSEVSR